MKFCIYSDGNDTSFLIRQDLHNGEQQLKVKMYADLSLCSQ